MDNIEGKGSWDIVSEVPRPPSADGRVASFQKCCFTSSSSFRINIFIEGGMVRREGFCGSSNVRCRWLHVVELMGMGTISMREPVLINVCKHQKPCQLCTVIGVGTINI